MEIIISNDQNSLNIFFIHFLVDKLDYKEFLLIPLRLTCKMKVKGLVRDII